MMPMLRYWASGISLRGRGVSAVRRAARRKPQTRRAWWLALAPQERAFAVRYLRRRRGAWRALPGARAHRISSPEPAATTRTGPAARQTPRLPRAAFTATEADLPARRPAKTGSGLALAGTPTRAAAAREGAAALACVCAAGRGRAAGVSFRNDEGIDLFVAAAKQRAQPPHLDGRREACVREHALHLGGVGRARGNGCGPLAEFLCRCHLLASLRAPSRVLRATPRLRRSAAPEAPPCRFRGWRRMPSRRR
jgi:hypothetical protein